MAANWGWTGGANCRTEIKSAEERNANIEKMREIVKEKPCKECEYYNPRMFMVCGNECGFYHEGFLKKEPKKETKYINRLI